MQKLDFENKCVVLSDGVKLLIALMFSVVFMLPLVGGNIFYVITALCMALFLVTVVIFRPHLFLSVFFAIAYPVSQTVGRLEVDNLGISFLLMLSLLALLFIVQRKQFAFDKNRILLFSYFYVIVAVVVFGSVMGFLYSGNDSLEILVKFFVFGVIPAFFLTVIPWDKENILSILELCYYLCLVIFLGFSFAYWFFRILNPGSFETFFYTFDNPIGTSLFMMQFILVSFVFSMFGNVSHKRKIFIYSTIGLAFFYVMVTFQRSFILAIASALTYFIVSKYRIGFKMVALALVISAFFAVALSNISMFLSDYQVSKLEKTLSLVEKLSKNKDILRAKENEDLGTIGYRIVKIVAAFGKIKEKPYFGNGLGTFSNFAEYKYPHNIIVEFLYSTGLVGFVLFIFCAVKLFLQSHLGIRKIKDEKLKNALLIVNSFNVLCIVILQFSGGVMNIFPHLYFMMSSVIIALFYIRRMEKVE